MQQLQEEIKKDIIKHPARNIEIIYEAGKTTMTAQDEELLAAYIRLHDFEFEMKQTADSLYLESVTANKRIDALREELMLVQSTFDKCCLLADKLGDDTYISDETNFEKLAEAREQTEIEIKDYSEKILEVYEMLKDFHEKLNKYNEANEEESDVVYTAYSEINAAHSVNWEINSINILTFEDEYARFDSYRTVSGDRRETLMRFCDTALNNYSNLNLQTTTLYNVWNEFIKRCKLLKALSDLHTKATGFTNN